MTVRMSSTGELTTSGGNREEVVKPPIAQLLADDASRKYELKQGYMTLTWAKSKDLAKWSM